MLIICVQVELSLAYQCNVSQESLLKYIHFNRHHNTLLIEHTVKMVKENRRLIDDNIIKQSAPTTAATTTSTTQAALPMACKNYNVLDSPARHFQTTSQTLCKDMGYVVMETQDCQIPTQTGKELAGTEYLVQLEAN